MSEPLLTRAIESGYRTLSRMSSYTAWAHFETLQANQWRPRQDLEAIRWTKMRELLAHAAREIPFYQKLWRAAGVDPLRFSSIADVRELPVVTRDALLAAQANDEFLLSRRSDYELTHSSGTTGARVYLPFTRRDMQVKYAGYLREFYATDWRLGMRSAAIHYFGHPEFAGRYMGEPDRDNYVVIRKLVFRLAHQRTLLDPYPARRSGDERVAAGWYRALRRIRPFLLETMEFGLLALWRYIEAHDLPRLRIPRMIVLSTLSPDLKAALEAFFETEIFNRYGPHEMEGVAYACHEHRGMHMAIDSVHTEFLDEADRPVAPGETGRVVLTDLDSRVMPLIRYQIGDLGSYRDEPCRCGRGFPLMDDIAGRMRDRFLGAVDGTTFLPSRLVQVLQGTPDVRLFQVIQRQDRSIEALIVPNGRGWSDEAARALTTMLADALPAGLPLRVVPTEAVELEANGKFSFARRAAD